MIMYDYVGGDQLTAARGRGSKRIRSNSTRGKDRLEGLEPIIEDWHAKVCLLGVSYNLLQSYCMMLVYSILSAQ